MGDSHSLRCFENHSHIADSKACFGYNKLDGKTAYKLVEHDKRVRKIITALKDKYLIFISLKMEMVNSLLITREIILLLTTNIYTLSLK